MYIPCINFHMNIGYNIQGDTMELYNETENVLCYTEIGDRIRQHRELKRMTQEQLSEKCDLSTGYIGHIERGTRSPSLETLAKLSQVLCVSLDELVFGACNIKNNQIKILSLQLEDKDPEKVEVFLKTVCALADILDKK